ncbi:vesicle-associated membrane protein 4 isoform X1 [Elephas maximus indicus]|uniref:vesicle-associated membrane protein 4 isoform X1 n=1 Tax=Elephas maximus indicus TaxID=99487 RepID=UPI0021172B92|nr:vesicle-associated membrane protein 4 isoform X1 [Elephas maximus indicus]XP_049737176.1 vesicle-associated membrane protein 4 isoform X1 [Elephas maximus indicus]XP_049737177.1 vesicle-associated membrane protein 4 isoform X1 [Elephas maximus indicus]
MPPKFKRHLNDDDVTGSVRSERRNLLEDDSDEEEDFFLRGPSGPRFGPRNDKIKHVQNQVDEVIDVMQENITKVIERGERLDELQDKSESLSDNATAFSNRSKQLRRQMWWRGCKDLNYCLSVGVRRGQGASAEHQNIVLREMHIRLVNVCKEIILLTLLLLRKQFLHVYGCKKTECCKHCCLQAQLKTFQ